MRYFTIYFRGPHIPTQIELWLSNSLQWEEVVWYLQYTSGILDEKKKVVRVYGDILIVISGISHPEVWVCLGRADYNQFEIILKRLMQYIHECIQAIY